VSNLLLACALRVEEAGLPVACVSPPYTLSYPFIRRLVVSKSLELSPIAEGSSISFLVVRSVIFTFLTRPLLHCHFALILRRWFLTFFFFFSFLISVTLPKRNSPDRDALFHVTSAFPVWFPRLHYGSFSDFRQLFSSPLCAQEFVDIHQSSRFFFERVRGRPCRISSRSLSSFLSCWFLTLRPDFPLRLGSTLVAFFAKSP